MSSSISQRFHSVRHTLFFLYIQTVPKYSQVWWLRYPSLSLVGLSLENIRSHWQWASETPPTHYCWNVVNVSYNWCWEKTKSIYLELHPFPSCEDARIIPQNILFLQWFSGLFLFLCQILLLFLALILHWAAICFVVREANFRQVKWRVFPTSFFSM